jgi:hypothetical protein
MMKVRNSDRDPNTPPEVIIKMEPREPVSDPTLGVPVPKIEPAKVSDNRLVVVGDSVSHGFQSGAIYNTDLSYPAIIAWEMGCFESFRFPTYFGFGGLPLNLEFLIRDLEEKFGADIPIWELPLALFAVRNHLAHAEEWWERGGGASEPNFKAILNNLSVYGWDLRDALSYNAERARARIKAPKDHLFVPLVSNANERAALRVLPNDDVRSVLSTLDAAAELGKEGQGIETLIIMLGANNALRTVTELRVVWTQAPAFQDLDLKDAFTIWNPKHFETELKLVESAVRKINARHVIWATVPHVTIAPVARGIGQKIRSGSRYFSYYTRPWIDDDSFDFSEDPHITENQARAVDCAVDQYNDAICDVVRNARKTDHLDWYVFEMAGLLDRLASRRYISDPAARPSWWTPYQLPAELNRLDPIPDSRFFSAVPAGRTAGGLFALDGVHPTTIGYGLIAQEIVKIMEMAAVEFRSPNGTQVRSAPVGVDFERLIRLDSLISRPPVSIGSDLKLIGWLNEKVDFAKRVFR